MLVSAAGISRGLLGASVPLGARVSRIRVLGLTKLTFCFLSACSVQSMAAIRLDIYGCSSPRGRGAELAKGDEQKQDTEGDLDLAHPGGRGPRRSCLAATAGRFRRPGADLASVDVVGLFAHHLQLLGTSPARWATQPIR